MASNVGSARRDVRYEPDETPPNLLSLGLGLQHAMIVVPGIVLSPAILIQSAGGSEAYVMWAVCTALVICGVTTAVQAMPVGRIGAGYVMMMGTSSAFLAISVSALEQGGPGLLATLIIVSSLFQFALAAKLSALRRIFTPTVAGTVVMLIPVTLSPILLRRLGDVPEAASPAAAPVTFCLTLLVVVVTAFRGSGMWRLWGPVLGVVAGSLVGGLAFGVYDASGVREASWIGVPPLVYPGLDLGFGPEFWALLPAFVLVTMVGAMDTLGDGVATQRVAWRRPRAIDFRSIQGALSADGLGNLLSGLAGTLPNTTYATGISVVELTGVAARSVGVAIGLIFVAVAFMPKVLAAIIAIPGPVVAGYFVLLLAKLFTFGLEILQQEGLDYRKSLAVGLAFWLGLAFQLDWIFPEYFQGPWSEMLGNGMTVGGLIVVGLTLFRGADRSATPAAAGDLGRRRLSEDGRIPCEARRREAVERRDDRAGPSCRRRDAPAADADGGRASGGGQEASAADRGWRGRYGGAGIHRGDRRGEPRRSVGGAERAGGGRTDGAGGVAAAAAALCLVGAAQPVPRHRRGHGSRGSGRRPVSRPACELGGGA